MGKSSYREKRLAGQVSLALAAGMFSVAPVAHGMPTLDNVETGAVKINDAVPVNGATLANDSSITSTTKNNVVNWKDFSIAQTESLTFDQNNYMNIVTGTATSAIDGKLTGGGDIYLINPNGVIFGSTAQVNVGNLYVSTREATDVMKSAFVGDQSITADVGNILTATTSNLTADVVNLIDTQGYVKADKVVMEGNNIRFVNASSVVTSVTDNGDGTFSDPVAHTDKTTLVLRADSDGYIHVGDEDKATGYKYVDQRVSANINNATTKTIGVDYELVHNAQELSNVVTNNSSKNYMLAKDIVIDNSANAVAEDKMSSAIGTAASPFKGKFDGNFYTVSDLHLSGGSANAYLGLFGHTSGARIENVGVKGFQLNGTHAGGIVGYAKNTTLFNVWNEGGNESYVGPKNAISLFSGSLVGTLEASTLGNAYNAGEVHGAGLVAWMTNSTVQNSYNVGLTSAAAGKIYGLTYYVNDSNSKITNSYSASKYVNGTSGAEEMGEGLGTYTNSYIIDSATSYRKNKSTTADPNIKNTLTAEAYSWSISPEGGANTTWRIYEGASLPLLTSFMKAKGTVSAEYTYDKNGTSTQSVDDTSSKVYSASKVGPTELSLYGANADAALLIQAEGTASKDLTGQQFAASIRKDVYVGSGTTAAKFALLYGGQQGYDLYGNNFTITKRSIAFTQETAPTFTKIYDGNADATDVLKQALLNADSHSTTGFIGSDKDYVDLQVKDGVQATYGRIGDGDTWTDKSDVNAADAPWDVKIEGASSTTITFAAKSGLDDEHKDIYLNYELSNEDIAALNNTFAGKGVITPRSVTVSLIKDTGIDKVYDGTSGLVGKFTVDGHEYDYATGNLSVAMDETDLTDAEKAALKTNDFGGQDIAIDSGYSAGYVKSDGATAATYVADTEGSTDHVAYTGIKLAGAALSSNYKLVDKDGNALSGDNTNGYKLLADGQITRRSISKDDLEYTGDVALKKVYDNTSALDDATLAGKSVTMKDDKLVDIPSADDPKGLLRTDATAGAARFVTTGKGTFYEEDGTTEAKDATDSGLANAAKKLGYGVVLDTAHMTADQLALAANYKIDGVNLEDASGFTLTTDGQIDRRSVDVALGQDTGINKVYDGTEAVDSQYTTGTIDKNGASGNLQYAAGSAALVDDGTSIAISADKAKTKYLVTQYETKAQYVALDASENVITTDDSKNVVFTIAMSGDKAANYTLNGVNMTNDAKEVTKNGTGKISQKELTVTFADVSKVYDGDAVVTNSNNDVITPTVEGLTGNDGYTSASIFEIGGFTGIQGQYGEGDTDAAFAANKDVGIGKDVQYTNLQQALKSKNYKISNTVYGKGAITQKKITKEILDDATDTKQPENSLRKVYDGDDNYTKPLTAADFIDWTDHQTAIAEGDKDSVTFTIAEAVYANANAGSFDGSAENDVKLTFNITGAASANYKFEGATVNADGSQTLTLTKGGYTGEIEKRKVTAIFNDPTPTKDYDGTTTLKKADGTTISDATIKSWFTPSAVAGEADSGLVAGEDVALSVTGAYTDKDAGTTAGDKTVQYTLGLINGVNNKASNYELVQADGTAPLTEMQGVGTINKRTVYVSSVDAIDKIYNQENSGANVLAQDTKGIHLAAVSRGSAEDDALAAHLLSDEGLAVIKPVAADAASGLKGQYGDLVGDAFTANANVKRNSPADPEEQRDTRYEGIDSIEALHKNYVLSVAMSGGKVKTENDKNIVYGKGTIKAANIDLSGVQVADTIRHEYDNSVVIKKEEALPAISGINADIAPLLDITASFSDDDVNVGQNKPIALTIALSGSDADANNYTISGASSMTINTAKGEIYARTLYAYIAENADTPLTKVYDGTNKVKQDNVSSWVKLTNPDRLLADGVTFVYDNDANVTYADANADESGNKVVNFTNVGLSNNNNKNYELVLLKTGETEETATNAPLTGNNFGTLTTTGIIEKRGISLKDFHNPADRFYNGTADVDIVDALRPTMEMELTDLSEDEKSAFLSDYGNSDLTQLELKEGSLKGVYGTWNPAGTEFQADSHVKYKDGMEHTEANVDQKDVLYYGMELKDSGVSKNYKVIDSGDKVGQVTIKSEDGLSDLASTVYFLEAKKKGIIKPLAISVAAVREKWTTPVAKVYDKNAWITSHGDYTAYDAEGNPITDSAAKYLTIYYDAAADTVSPLTDEEKAKIGQVKIAYDVTAADFSATYDDVNAGERTFTYNGLAFNTATLEDFKVDRDDLAAHYAAGVSSATAQNYETGVIEPVTGTIARRLVNVTEDGVAHDKTYEGTNQWNVVAAGTAYTAGVAAATNHTGFIPTEDKAYITYEANYVKSAVKNADVAFDEGGNVTFKDVEYTFTLTGDNAANYTLDADKQTTFDTSGLTKSVTQTGKSTIRQREVYVDFAGDGTGFDKVYDNSSAIVLPDGTAMKDVLVVKSAVDDPTTGEHTGIVDDDAAQVKLDYANVKANYVNNRGAANGDVTMSGSTVTAKKVYFQNLNLTGAGKENYVVKAKNAGGNAKALATDQTQTVETLEGSGKIEQRVIALELKNTPVVKQYDGTAQVKDYNGVAYATDNVTIKAAGIVDGVQTYDIADGESWDDLDVEVTSAIYHDASGNATSNAGSGLGVTYRLKLDNRNYTLLRTSLDTTGDIKQYVLKTKTNVSVDDMSKVYDGTTAVTTAPSVLADDLFDFSDADNPISAADKATLLRVDSSQYDHADTGAAEDAVEGAEQNVTFSFTIQNGNYTLSSANNTTQTTATNVDGTGLSSTGTFTGTGRIDRAPLTLTPNSATYSAGDTIPTDGYTGTVTGFKGTDSLSDDYAVTFGRDGNTSTSPGNYTLLGYVNGDVAPAANGMVYYNNLSGGTSGNYYFVTAPNQALHINAKMDVTDEVQRDTIADKKFTPDDYSYNRISQDEDLTRLNRESQASVQYAEKGVNIDGDDDAKSGLASMADVQGSGSVVNLDGAVIRTSAVQEAPEEIAAEAALPVPEAEESDVSSIDLEYADEKSGSQSMLEILTNASNNAENKGTSIVIHTMDEDEEDAEEEKSRRALIVDRSNIGIETLGDAVNLDQMIG